MSSAPREAPPPREQIPVWRACEACRLVRRKCPHKTPVLLSARTDAGGSSGAGDVNWPTPASTRARRKSITYKSRKRKQRGGDGSGEETLPAIMVRPRPARLEAIDPDEGRKSRWSSAVPEERGGVGTSTAAAADANDEYGEVIVVRRPAWMLARMARLAQAAMGVPLSPPTEPTTPVRATPPVQTDLDTSMPPPALSSEKRSRGRPRKRPPGTEQTKRARGRPKKYASTLSSPQIEDENTEPTIDDLMSGLPSASMRPASPPVDDAYMGRAANNIEPSTNEVSALPDVSVNGFNTEIDNDTVASLTAGAREPSVDLTLSPPAVQQPAVEAKARVEIGMGAESRPDVEAQPIRGAIGDSSPPSIPLQHPFRTSPPPVPPRTLRDAQSVSDEEFLKWRVPGAPPARFSGPKLYTPLTMHPPMGGLGLILLSERDGRRRDQLLMDEVERYRANEVYNSGAQREPSPEL